MNNLLRLFCLLLVFTMTMAGQPSAKAETKRPNILWIVGENFSNDLGCHGQSNVATPHLDALAEAGIRYINAFSTSPVCAPSRSCFMLGMYQATTDTHHMRSLHQELHARRRLRNAESLQGKVLSGQTVDADAQSRRQAHRSPRSR